MKLFEPNKPYVSKISVGIANIAELNKQATAFKGNNWSMALACLLKAKELSENQYQDFMQRLRLPLFLQQAGEFEAAKYEFAYLLGNIDRFVELEAMGHQDKRRYKTFVKNLCLERLYDKARVAFKREKLLDESEQCRLLSEQYHVKRLEALEELNAARKNKIDKHHAEFPIDRLNSENNSVSIQNEDDLICANGMSDLKSANNTDYQKAQKQGCFSTAAVFVISIGFLTWLFF